MARRKEACPLDRERLGASRRSEDVLQPAASAVPLTPAITLETDRIAREVVIGFTAFRRPACVVRLVESIRRYYPTIRIVITDNGDRPADLSGDPHVDDLTLPFDCGISAARNAIVDHLERGPDYKYLWLLDDDLILTHESRVGDFLAVLDAEPSIGQVGGVIHDQRSGRSLTCTWSMDLSIEAGRLIGRLPVSPTQQTACGITYYRSDTCHNFALIRRELFQEHRWDDRLKVQEHFDWHLGTKAGRWRTATAESVRCLHSPERAADYDGFRRRNQEHYEIAFAKWGVSGFDQLTYEQLAPRTAGRPNIVLLGIGHSGTSITARMLHALGWHAGDADEEYAESVSVREINDAIGPALVSGPALAAGQAEALARLPAPWAIKDPRFVETLPEWLDSLRPYRPLLLWLTRDREAVLASHLRRGTPIVRGGSYERAWERCREHYAAWPWQKIRIDFEQIAAAAALFRQETPRPPGGGDRGG